ncbi:MAG: leucyl aminopeptidase, partial [Candidatus Magasanikbacteria bacterium]|nr:leucyl aminopeptidase [Candidatus Magasanikbacteria bacterium]
MKYSILEKTGEKRTAGVTTVVPMIQGDKNRAFSSIITEEHFKAGAGEQLYALVPHGDGHSHVMLVGLGEKKKVTAPKLCSAIASATRAVQDKKQTRAIIQLSEDFFELDFSARDLGETLARQIGLTTYHFSEYITDTERHVAAMTEIFFSGVPKKFAKNFAVGLESGRLIDEAVRAARDLGNHNPSNMHPEELGRQTIALAKGIAKLSVRVLNKKEIEKEKMGGLLGVSAGSDRPPAFIIMEYRGGKTGDAPTVLVGKGITFDAGGISIKPSSKMDEMKFDMLGGATVIGALLAIAKLKLPVNVVGLVPAAENLPSGSAIVPSDILRMHSGKTVEVLDTDAEGRLVLADALSYAARFKPRQMIDLATLTGACVVAMGETRAGMWSTDEKLAARLSAASEKTGELVWRLP